MLSVFGDDSADETRQRVFAVAGVIAPEWLWQKLEDAWLRRTGGIPFHATDCDSDHGDYAGNSHKENKHLYRDLSIMLAKSGAWGFGAALDLAAHREFFPGVPQDMSYYKGFEAVVTFLKTLARDRFNETVKFTFDNRFESNHNAADLYDVLVNDPDYSEVISDGISFTVSRRQPRIQIADLLARETMKHLDHMIGPIKRVTRKPMEGFFATTHFGFDFYRRDYFKDKLTKMETLERKAGFNQQDYLEWLQKRKTEDNIGNRFKFLAWLDRRDTKP